MICKQYSIYDQEPSRTLWDFLLILVISILPIFFIDKINLPNKVFTLISVSYYFSTFFIFPTIFSKYVTSKKYEVTLTESKLEITCISNTEQHIISIDTSEIVKVEEERSGGRFTHLKIYTLNDRIITFTKFDLYFLIRDDFAKFSKDLLFLKH